MPASLRALLEQLIDYAGLFPPASLPLEPALRNYAAYRGGPDAWMLGRFLCPASRLAELDPLVPLFAAGPPLALTVIARRAPAIAAAPGDLSADLARLHALRARHGPVVAAEVLELPLPPGPPGAILATATELARAAGLRLFCEPAVHPAEPGWEEAVHATVAALAAHNACGGPPAGLKLRAGGVTADAFPSPDQLAAALVAARDAGLALKCTAGLHHPFRQYRAEVATPMHGFVNVFVAGILAHLHGLQAAEVAAILADEDPGSFRFADDGLAWRELVAPTAEVARLRAEALIGYGSCSFDEPRDDLRALRIL
ncbi:MAG: hypothetical protein OHK0015_19510 [Chloroflexi bacterium OHK40]